jgi:hypothetical protein
MKKKQFVYIGQYYHIKDKELPLDYKFGVTDDLSRREYSLGRTKSPIKYMILKAWEIPSNVKREIVEKLIATIFEEYKYDGCEWYDIDGDTFQNKIASLFSIISDMVTDGDFNFKEVEIDDHNKDEVEKEIEKEIRTGRAASTNLYIQIDDIDLSGESAKDGFINAINHILTKVAPTQFLIDFSRIFKQNSDDYPDWVKSIEKIGNFYIDTHSSTNKKKRPLDDIIRKYNLNGKIEIK